MIPKLPRFNPRKRYWLKGETLNKIIDAIIRRTPIAGKGLQETHTKKGVILRLDPELDSSSSSSPSSKSSSSPSSDSSSPSSDSSPSSGSPSDSPSSGSPSPSGSPPSGSKSAIVPCGDAWIAWYCEERPDVVFSDQISIRSGQSIALPNEFLESVEVQTIRVVNAIPSDRPGTAFARVLAGAETRVKVEAKAWGLWFWSRKPAEVMVRIEAIRKGFLDARWSECSEDVAKANFEFWSKAHEPAETHI